MKDYAGGVWGTTTIEAYIPTFCRGKGNFGMEIVADRIMEKGMPYVRIDG